MPVLPTTSVAILSCSEPARLAALVARIGEQHVVPDEILVIWNSRQPLERPLSSAAPVRVIVIPPEEFGHGRTRNLALRCSRHEVLVLLSDDAWPVDEHWLEHLLRPFAAQAGVAAVFGRQIVEDEGSPDAVFRQARYPAASFALGLAPGRVLDLARTPASNANAAYRVAALRAAGGFVEDLISSEDIAAAVTLLDAGHTVLYAGDSRVVHSHRYAFVQQVRRTFDMAVSQQQICRRSGLRLPRGGGYGALLRALVRVGADVPWRVRRDVAADVGARVLGVLIARLSPTLPTALLRRVSTQRWYYARRPDEASAS